MAISKLEDGKNVNIDKSKNMRREIKKKEVWKFSKHWFWSDAIYSSVDIPQPKKSLKMEFNTIIGDKDTRVMEIGE